jgi:hypothetical protein
VDEAALPKMLRALANKLMERRFILLVDEHSFSKNFYTKVCSLLSKSGFALLLLEA